MKKNIIITATLSLFLLSACQSTSLPKKAASESDKGEKASSAAKVTLEVVDNSSKPAESTTPIVPEVKNTTLDLGGMKVEGVMDVNAMKQSKTLPAAKSMITPSAGVKSTITK